jgi:hypothetical protein
MSREKIDAMLAELRELRAQTLAELSDVTPDEFSSPSPMERWDDLRRVLLRFGDHLREHANQIEDTRQQLDQRHTMPQRMLAEGEIGYGKLLASLVGLTDEDLTRKPPDGGWSVLEVLEHIIQGERNYLNATREARKHNQG